MLRNVYEIIVAIISFRVVKYNNSKDIVSIFATMKNILIALLLLFTIGLLNAQSLADKEQQLLPLANNMLNDTTEKGRVGAVVKFIPALVEALKTPSSFAYPFDELRNYISILNAPDNSFRIFTWQLTRDNGSYRYYGAIQKNNLEKLELFPLLDFSDSLEAKEGIVIADLKLNNNEWYGALYYNVIQKTIKKQNYYFLFGYDGTDLWSNKKIMEVLWFENGKPVFGAPLIQATDKKKFQHRHLLQYRKDASVTFNYNAEEKMVLLDHLIAPEDRLYDLQFSFIPDGSYAGFKWKKGKWLYVDKIKTQSLGDGKAPVSKPIDFSKKQQQIK